MMATLTSGLRTRWNRLDARSRRQYAVAGLLAAAACVIVASVGLRSEYGRLSLRESQVADQLKTLQNDIAEIKRLKERTERPSLVGPPLEAAIVASLQSRGLPLIVSVLDAEHVRIQGTADFDQVVSWLASVQQSQRLDLKSMSASRMGGATKVELVLSVAQE